MKKIWIIIVVVVVVLYLCWQLIKVFFNQLINDIFDAMGFGR